MPITALKQDKDVQEDNQDVLGGGFTVDTGTYAMIVDVAFLSKTDNGATMFNLHLKPASGRRPQIREKTCVVSGDEKGNHPYYIKNGKKHPLPGWSLANLVAQITTGKGIDELDTQERTIKLYDFNASAERPTKVDAFTDMIGKPILAGIHKVRTNKRARDGQGGWMNLPEDNTFNRLHKVFHTDGFSVAEKDGGSEKPVFIETWRAEFGPDYIKDEYENVAPPVGAETDPTKADMETTSLFKEDD